MNNHIYALEKNAKAKGLSVWKSEWTKKGWRFYIRPINKLNILFTGVCKECLEYVANYKP